MDLTRETINRILELAPANLIDVEGRPYSDKQISPVRPPQAETIKLHTLTGLILFHQTSSIENVQVLIDSPTCVKLVGPIEQPWKTRTVYVNAECYSFDFAFGRYYPQEEFVIKLMTQFAGVGQRDETLKLVGNVTNEHATKLEDDGFTQRITVKKGARFELETVLNPELAPLRTFGEIDPLISRFVLRHKDGNFALFDADGEKWKYSAIEAIREYLKSSMPEVTVLY